MDSHWHFLAGALGGATAATVTCPLEVVKTRLQSSTAERIPLHRIFANIVKYEGARSLFRGLGATIAGVGPARATYFGTYNICKNTFAMENGSVLHLASAATAGITTSTGKPCTDVVQTSR